MNARISFAQVKRIGALILSDEWMNYLGPLSSAHIYQFRVYSPVEWLASIHLGLFDTVHHGKQCSHQNLQSIESKHFVHVTVRKQNEERIDHVHPEYSIVYLNLEKETIKLVSKSNLSHANVHFTRSSLVTADSGALLTEIISSFAVSYSDKSILRG